MTPRKHPPCTGCSGAVDIHGPHVLLATTLQTVHAAGGHTEVHATRTIGTWHVDCARTWHPAKERR